jgi:hypothetical protein
MGIIRRKIVVYEDRVHTVVFKKGLLFLSKDRTEVRHQGRLLVTVAGKLARPFYDNYQSIMAGVREYWDGGDINDNTHLYV